MDLPMNVKINSIKLIACSSLLSILASCAQIESNRVLLTSESGEFLAEEENVVFSRRKTSGLTVSIDIENKRQSLDGIGSSLTESSAFVLASLPPEKRAAVLEELYGQSGANFPITRVHMGSCDFSVEGKYSYAEVAGDILLENFSLNRDKEGFSIKKYPLIKDSTYDLLPLIKEVVQIKENQADSEFRIVASPWTAPAWMKDNNAYFLPGHGGQLRKEYYGLYAKYFISYFQEMQKKGIINKEEAKQHPNKSVLNRAIGIEEKVEIDIIKNITLHIGNIFVLCTDGLAKVTAEEIQKIASENSPEIATSMLINMANERGGKDNVTVQIIKLEEDEVVEPANVYEAEKVVNKKSLLKGLFSKMANAIIKTKY